MRERRRELPGVELHRGGDIERGQLVGGQVGVHARQMRVADIDGEPGERPAADDRLARAELVRLAHFDGDVGVGGIPACAAPPAAGPPASRRRTRRGSPARWPAGSGRTPGRRCRTSARSSRRRCDSPCTSRRPPRLRAAGRRPRRRRPRRPWSPAARRRRRSPGGGRTARPPRRAGAAACRPGRAAARNRSACRGPWRTSPDQDTWRHTRSVSSTLPSPAPSSQVIRWSRRNQDRCRRT